MTDNLKEREAFKQYLSECDDCAIVPDVAGAFAWAWRAALAQAQSCVLADDLLRLANAWRNAMTTRGHVDAGNAMEEAMRRLAASPQPQPVQPIERTGCTAGTDEECTKRGCANNCPAQAKPEQQDIPPEMAEVLNKTIWELHADGAAPEQQDHSEQHLDMVAQAFNAQKDWLHLKGYGYATGNYMNKCHRCEKVVHWVAKRATTCRPCAEAMYSEANAQQAEAQQPCATILIDVCADHCGAVEAFEFLPKGTPLFTRPQPAQLQALSDAKILELIEKYWNDPTITANVFARIVQSALAAKNGVELK